MARVTKKPVNRPRNLNPGFNVRKVLPPSNVWFRCQLYGAWFTHVKKQAPASQVATKPSKIRRLEVNKVTADSARSNDGHTEEPPYSMLASATNTDVDSKNLDAAQSLISKVHSTKTDGEAPLGLGVLGADQRKRKANDSLGGPAPKSQKVISFQIH